LWNETFRAPRLLRLHERAIEPTHAGTLYAFSTVHGGEEWHKPMCIAYVDLPNGARSPIWKAKALPSAMPWKRAWDCGRGRERPHRNLRVPAGKS
jgi:hypothetical protein